MADTQWQPETLGGRATDRDAFSILKPTGRFVTIIGPAQHIGETKLCWFKFLGVVAHVATRTCATRIRGSRYLFAATRPRNSIQEAMQNIVKHNISMPIEREIEFDLLQVKNAIRLLTSHRTTGRIVINFEKSIREPTGISA